MNQQQARALVTETFQRPFDEGRFRNFAINLLNQIDESKAQSWNTTYIKDAFKGHVKGYKRLGTYTSPEQEKLDVLIVHLTTEAKLERARAAIRNFVAHHLKSRDSKDAALVAFVSPTERQWRFSYVKMDYAAVQKDDGKVGVQTTLTPARRSSYIVGEGESCHTAQSRFLELLQDTENKPTLAQIEAAFSVEAVTKEFFEQYKALFLDLKDELDKLAKKDKTLGAEFAAKKVSTADFAKKLMGQIVFLNFLQKKGWLGVSSGGAWGDGPHTFLRELHAGKFRPYKNFFNDILEPLFYDTLASDRGHEAWCKTLNSRIPFLNGGLFEPLAGYNWRKTDIAIPNSLFSNTQVNNEGDTGTGILDVFDRYNFTVNEAEPLEKEVAIDPEMLGKVFENLLEVKERKSKGSYYTPRAIVHYMCQESLINYLDTALNTAEDSLAVEKPRQTKLFSEPESEQVDFKTTVRRDIVPRGDIATFIYSGDQASYYEAARVEGSKSYLRELPKTIETHARLLDDKLADIAVCDPAIGSGAFPVGMMQDIVRSRAALTPYFNDVRDRTAYHFKRHAIQTCLYGVDIDPGAVEIAKLRLWLSLVVDEDNVKQIKPLPNLDYKIVVGNSLMGFPFKSRRQKDIEMLKLKFFDEPDHDIKAKLKRQIDDDLSAGFAAAKKSLGYEVTFDFEVWFSEVFDRKSGFDVIIANPPYVRQEGIKELKPLLQHQFQCYTGVADLYVYFLERSVKLLRGGGALAFITSNKYFRAGYGEKLRRFLAASTRIKHLIDFGELPVFTAGTDPAILILTREVAGPDHQLQAAVIKDASEIERITQAVASRSNARPQSSLQAQGWTLENSAVLALLAKLRRVGRPLNEVVAKRFYYGIKTALNEAFVIDRTTRDELIAEHKSSADILRPFLNGRDVLKWQAVNEDIYLIKIESSLNKEHPWSQMGLAEAERTFKKHYPAVHRWLMQFRADLIAREDQGVFFWELRSCDYWSEFEQPRIIFNETSKELHAFFDESGLYTNKTLFMLVAPQPKPLLALLLSGTLDWLYRHEFPSWGDPWKGGRVQFRGDRMATVPIPDFPSTVERSLTRLVDRILVAKKRDAGADVSALERELDELVYALYGLTEEDKALVQAAFK